MPRGEIFLTTKLNNPDQRRPLEALEYSLQQLETPYLDLCTYPTTKYRGRRMLSIRRADALARPC